MKKVWSFALIIMITMVLAACNGSEDLGTINVYTRDTSSGTRDGFMNGIDFGDASANDSLLVDGFITNDNNGIMTAMTTDTAGIGYVSLASLNQTVKGLNFNGVEPTIENVMNDSYGLKRPFNYMVRLEDDFENDRERDLTYAFIAFLESNDGADVINDEGAVSVSATGNFSDIREDYPVCDLDNSEYTLNFGGSDAIQSIAEALSDAFSPRCGNVNTVNDHTGSSDGYKRTQGEEKDGVNAKHVGYASRPFRGEELSNDESTRGQLAWDAIVAIVHNDNPLNNITADELKRIYSGDITEWSTLTE